MTKKIILLSILLSSCMGPDPGQLSEMEYEQNNPCCFSKTQKLTKSEVNFISSKKFKGLKNITITKLYVDDCCEEPDTKSEFNLEYNDLKNLKTEKLDSQNVQIAIYLYQFILSDKTKENIDQYWFSSKKNGSIHYVTLIEKDSLLKWSNEIGK